MPAPALSHRAVIGTLILMLCSTAGCPGDDGGGASGSPTASGVSSSQNDFGGSGLVLDNALTSPFVLFQNDAVTRAANRGGAIQQNGVNNIYSIGAYVDPNDANKIKFFVNDRGNNRVLIFNTVPQNGSSQPDVVVGQANFTSGAVNGGGALSDSGFSDNVHVSVCSNGKMFVSDRGNNRVLVYNAVPQSNGATADFVIGQPNFTTNTQINPPTAGSLFRPYSAYCMANRLFVVDKDNNRILVFDPIPTSSAPVASYVIGQPDFVTNSSGCTAGKLFSPYEVLRVGDTVIVADGGNHRVLRFDTIPAATGAAATAALGQPDLTSCQPNQGGGPTAATLNFPNALAAKNNVLAVSDHTNNRTMFFALPFTSNQAAVAQNGQPNFTTNADVNPPTANSVASTKGLIFDRAHIWVGDGQNHRLNVMPLPAGL